MPEHIRALIVVLVLGGLVWLLARPAMVQIIPEQTYLRWRRLWFFTTLAWFLSQSFWIYVGVMAAMLFWVRRRESQVFGLYLLLLMAAPQAQTPVPGMGVIDFLFMLDHYRLLALALLLPCALRLYRDASSVRLLRNPLDWTVLAFLLVMSAVAYRSGHFFSDSRTAVFHWIDWFLPYYVASRSIRDVEGLRHALVGLAMAGALLAILALFELIRSWKLYDAATVALGLPSFGLYKARGAFIRPAVSIVDSIVLGHVIVVGAGAYLYLQSLIKERKHVWLGWACLSIGIVASLSRGPWVGAGLLVVIFMLTSAKPFKRVFQTAVGGVLALLLLSTTHMGEQMINLLPVIGAEEQGNVDYRADLLTVSLPVISRSLLFGSSDYLQAPELQVMRTGEGIIDIVNSYLGVILYTGVVGLTAFVGMFISALVLIRRGMGWARRTKRTDEWVLGRALFATVLSIMFIIFTLSSIYIVPIMYFSLFGISSAYFLQTRTAERTRPGERELP